MKTFTLKITVCMRESSLEWKVSSIIGEPCIVHRRPSECGRLSVPFRLRMHLMSRFLRMESPLRSRLSGMDCKASLANSRSIYTRDRQ